MLKKSYSKTGKKCRVTFRTAEDVAATEIRLLGDFNGWQPEAHPMAKRKDGTFSVTLSLDAGGDYRFRYLLDDGRWLNEDAPDGLVPNRFGGRDCVVSV